MLTKLGRLRGQIRAFFSATDGGLIVFGFLAVDRFDGGKNFSKIMYKSELQIIHSFCPQKFENLSAAFRRGNLHSITEKWRDNQISVCEIRGFQKFEKNGRAHYRRSRRFFMRVASGRSFPTFSSLVLWKFRYRKKKVIYKKGKTNLENL